MSKANSSDAESGKPLPHCKALLLCEKVTESQLTGKITLHNLIETFLVPAFPARSTRFTIFLEVYDGIGRYPVRVEFNGLTDGSAVAELELDDLDFSDRLAKIQVTVPIDFLNLPSAGRFELVVFVRGELLASQHFEAEVGDGGY